jgi:hypothetical protein
VSTNLGEDQRLTFIRKKLPFNFSVPFQVRKYSNRLAGAVQNGTDFAKSILI